MKTNYFLVFDSREFFLCEFSHFHFNEEMAVHDFELFMRSKRDVKFEDTIQAIYTNHFGKSLSQSSVYELLKLLLAKGFHLVAKTDDQILKLAKNFYPVKYAATLKNISQGLGEFYFTSVAGPDEQFPKFCRWLDTLCGVTGMGHRMANQMVSGGFSIKAETDKYIILLEVTSSGEVVGGREFTLQYLTGEHY